MKNEKQSVSSTKDTQTSTLNSVGANQEWKKWRGKVLGDDNDIQNALKILKREPKDVYELQSVIVKLLNRANEEMSTLTRDTRY